MKLSVVLATYNRSEALARCLGTLFDQDIPAAQVEIVVVVDGSRDGTREMLRALNPLCALVVIEQENRGQTAALNAGVQAATGEIILFLDDDLVCDRGLLGAHLSMHTEGAAMLVFGRMKTVPGTDENLAKYYRRLDVDPQPKWPDDAWAGPNCSIPRAVFLAAGGYDERLFPRRGEDVDLGIRLWKSGVRFRFLPDAVTLHASMKSSRECLRDALEDGASTVRLCRKHPEMRSRSPLFGPANARGWKRYAVAMAANCSVVAHLLPAALGQRIARVAGARREAGSWRRLREMLGCRLSVLLYHHIGLPTPGKENLYLTVTPAKFRRQVRWLRWRGYTAITSAQWLAWLDRGEPLPPKPVLFTFDDAYADIATHAFPFLDSSVVFAITKKTGDVTSWDGLPLMTMEQLQYWSGRGVEIGAHSRTHPDLTTVADGAIDGEVSGSRDDLIDAGLTPVSFAYPYGYFDARVRRSVEGAFPLAFTCEEGLNDLCTDRLLLRRTMVSPGDTLIDIELRAALGRSPLNALRSTLRLRSRFKTVLRTFRLLPR